jgi:hypothetical protein
VPGASDGIARNNKPVPGTGDRHRRLAAGSIHRGWWGRFLQNVVKLLHRGGLSPKRDRASAATFPCGSTFRGVLVLSSGGSGCLWFLKSCADHAFAGASRESRCPNCRSDVAQLMTVRPCRPPSPTGERLINTSLNPADTANSGLLPLCEAFYRLRGALSEMLVE